MAPSVDEAYAFCRGLAKERAGNFYFAFLPLPKPQRHAIYAAYAFSRACDDYSDEDIELERKRELLEGHRRLLHETFEGRPQGQTFVALWDAVQRYGIPREYFDAVIDGVLMDLTISRYETFEELFQYCYHVASVVGLICIEIFGYADFRAKKHAIDLGVAMQLVNIMRDVKEDAERDRIYLPLDEIARFGYSEPDLMSGVVNEAFVALMRFQAETGPALFRRGRPVAADAPRSHPRLSRHPASALL